jgi:beta-lactamase class A
MISILTLTLTLATLAPIKFVVSKPFGEEVKKVVEALAKELNQPELIQDVEIAAATVDRPTRTLTVGDYNGGGPMYPASVVKLFYLAYAYQLVSERKLKLTDEITRALRDMIVDSSNDATGLIVDLVTGTTGGPELGPKELAEWMNKRQAANRYFKSLGYEGVNACQKTWNEGPYGRERQGYGPKFELRNSLTPIACLRLISEISMDGIVGPSECDAMRSLLARNVGAESSDPDDQSKFAGRYLPTGTLLWSKAGWVSSERHDVAFVKTPNGKEFALAIFTKHNSTNSTLIGELAKRILTNFGAL